LLYYIIPRFATLLVWDFSISYSLGFVFRARNKAHIFAPIVFLTSLLIYLPSVLFVVNRQLMVLPILFVGGNTSSMDVFRLLFTKE